MSNHKSTFLQATESLKQLRRGRTEAVQAASVSDLNPQLLLLCTWQMERLAHVPALVPVGG